MAAWGSEKRIPWVSMTTSRAVENQTYFVALTQTGKLRDGANLGYSMILDYKGEVLSDIEKKEGGFYATIDLEEMYSFRDKCRVLDDIKESYEVIEK
jgi:predicted amidohydrolase